MRYATYDIVFQEVPDEVSLLFTIPGCRQYCQGCHSSELWESTWGCELSDELYLDLLHRYIDQITCVCFLGGEWYEEDLKSFLKIAKQYFLKTCLYTGKKMVSKNLLPYLDFVKVGAWQSQLGGLDSPKTNQKFIHVPDGQILNYKFLRQAN